MVIMQYGLGRHRRWVATFHGAAAACCAHAARVPITRGSSVGGQEAARHIGARARALCRVSSAHTTARATQGRGLWPMAAHLPSDA